jgi:predicted MFS family arabinose efflux permease
VEAWISYGEVAVRRVRRWVGDTVGGLPRDFWYLWTNTLINRLGSFVVIFLAIYLTRVRHFDVAFAGIVISLWGAGGTVGTLVGGVLADRWGRRPTLLTALYANSGLMITLGLVHARWHIALTVLGLGLLGEAARPAMSALLIDLVPEQDRLRAFSLNYWVLNLGFAFASVLAGLLASVNYLWLFFGDAATTLIGATVVALKVREPARPLTRPAPNRVPASHPIGATRGLRHVFADRVFLGFTACNLLTALVFMQHISTLPITMNANGLSTRTFGAVIAINGIMIVAGQLFVPRLLRRVAPSTALAGGALLMGGGFGLTAVAHSALAFAACVLIWTCGEMLNAPSSANTIAELAPADLRGRYQGVFQLSWSTASFAAPILGALVYTHAGSTSLWLGCLALGVAVSAIQRASGPARRRRTDELRRALAPAPTGRATEPAGPVVGAEPAGSGGPASDREAVSAGA